MAKTIDKNGFWFIPHNPISKVGIFDYLGSSISDECEPNKIYKVFRSGETLLNSVPTWDNPPKPFINDHEMLGEGFTEVDNRHVQGVITNPQYEDGVLYADITVYSEALKDAIENGKKELSLGYFCKFEKQAGVYDGQPYDYIQTNMVGNHIALVDAGRCGSDVKVFDQKCVMDSFDIVQLKKNEETANIENEEKETATKDEEMADKREYIRKIMAIAAKSNSDFEGGEEEKIETIAKLLEESEYSKSESGKAEDEEEKEEKAEDKCGKDEEAEKETADESEKEESKDEEEKKAEDEDIKASEVFVFLQTILDEVRKIGERKVADESEEKKETEDESEKEKSEDEKEEEKSDEKSEDEEKETGDGVLFTFGQDKAIDGEDPAIKAYLA